ncbi:hypothetical protein HSX37_05220|uniref:Uncharacterized protein n=1 Tax=Dendrosporobacter quercicolus TaxID=146817 RepID=A0A1G9NU48_9FIRM|nr:hypothetical protein [Dendrosporobacter quercicolus]NSL47441.1 hypothetical protein [Dendrosporobacter quercicolus DSM 1736]SDL89567.1 hypothetical protein SAMN04488502_1011117 [Dendrosporobacter quercicolus]
MDIEITGYDDLEIEELMRVALADEEGNSPKKQAVEDDFDAEGETAKIKTPVTKPGDILVTWPASPVCGDAAKAEDVQLLVDGKLCNMVFTDPPYTFRTLAKRRTVLKFKTIAWPMAIFTSFS